MWKIISFIALPIYAWTKGMLKKCWQTKSLTLVYLQHRQVVGAAHTAQAQAGVAADPGLAAPAIQPDVLAQQQAVHRLSLRHYHHQHHPVRHESSLLQRLCNSVWDDAQRILHDFQVYTHYPYIRNGKYLHHWVFLPLCFFCYIRAPLRLQQQ